MRYYRRVEIDVSIQFLPGGEMTAEMASPFIDMTIKPGEWSVRPSAGSFRRRMNSEGGQAHASLRKVYFESCTLNDRWTPREPLEG